MFHPLQQRLPSKSAEGSSKGSPFSITTFARAPSAMRPKLGRLRIIPITAPPFEKRVPSLLHCEGVVHGGSSKLYSEPKSSSRLQLVAGTALPHYGWSGRAGDTSPMSQSSSASARRSLATGEKRLDGTEVKPQTHSPSRSNSCASGADNPRRL